MVTETLELKGHILDSLILPKVLDEILEREGRFEILEMAVGERPTDMSRVRLRVEATAPETLEAILVRLREQGAEPVAAGDVTLVEAPADGVFPDGFYVSTNFPTSIRVDGRWVEVFPVRMDCGIAYDPGTGTARTAKFAQVRRGDMVVVGDAGVRVEPLSSARSDEAFEFMASSVSSEKPKSAMIRRIAAEMGATKARGGRILVVAGPAIVHTGAGPHLVRLIERGYVDVLFAGNALAVHDIEQALFGTALGIHVEHGVPALAGHEHHIRAINAIRAAGGIRAAVDSGLVPSGIMHACIRKDVDFVLAGSIRDDGPLPEVVTDVLHAQCLMAEKVQGCDMALMIATMLHSVATGNLLPATCKTVCVDINPAVVTKLADRGTHQAVGLVTDVEPFFAELLGYLGE
jgi:lysine-ketoglutarate reductase/saccharopine dehydrogenase-like protein (TIGR00300 family)